MNLFHNQWLYIIILTIITFLVVLNGYLRGSLKFQIDAILGVILAAVFVLIFIFIGWKVGLVFLFGIFLFGALIRPIAQLVAKKLIGG